ncbi:MAG: enoyl-CoA hydratase [Methylibium sp. NZG]|nr:MAG: enoyl-CoA hydratase [Methylibium sp. NZG]
MEAIDYTVQDHVATVTLNRPAQRNALDETMKRELTQVVREVQADRGVRALVIAGSGGAFCAGGDIRGMQGTVLDSAGGRARMIDIHEFIGPLIQLDRPVIAAVDGAAYGAGFSLALAADFVLASPQARFCMSFMRVGLVPDCGAFYTLPRVVGAQRAKELMLSAREVGVDEALRLGIVMEVHPADVLLARAQAVAASFVHAGPAAVSMIKRAVAASGHNDLNALLEIEANAQAVAFGTPQHREAVGRFLGKQPALFQWPK